VKGGSVPGFGRNAGVAENVLEESGSELPHSKKSRRGFGAEHALEARPGELHTDQFLAVPLRIADVNDASLRGEVGFPAPRSIVRKRDADFEVGTNGHVEPRHKSGATAAKIFAGSFFFEHYAAFVATADAQRKAYRDSTFRALTRNRRAQRDHGLGPHFC
jgi:hypothetical protein